MQKRGQSTLTAVVFIILILLFSVVVIANEEIVVKYNPTTSQFETIHPSILNSPISSKTVRTSLQIDQSDE